MCLLVEFMEYRAWCVKHGWKPESYQHWMQAHFESFLNRHEGFWRD